MTSSRSQLVGFVGLGAMGLGMACTLVKAGFRVKGYDINPDALRTFTEAGGEGAASAAEAAQGAGALVIMVVNAEQAEQVLFGPGGACDSLPEGSVAILSSTVRPEFARNTAARLYAAGREMIDAPVSGGVVKAANGALIVMASGHPAAFEKVDPVLSAMAGRVYRLGDECGQGSRVKMVNQLLVGVHIAAAAEAVALGVRAGIDVEVLYEVISNSSGCSWVFQNRVPHMIAGDYRPESAVEIFLKDLGIVLEAGREMRFPLPLSAAAHQLFLMAAAAGLGKEDHSAVVKIFEQLAKISVSKNHSQ